MRAIFLFVLTFLVTACGNTVDASDPQSFRESIAEIASELDEAEKESLRQSLIILAFDTYEPTKGLWSRAALDAPVLLAARDEIDGLNAREIVALAEAKKRALIDSEIELLAGELSRQKKAREKNAGIFDNIKIDDEAYRIHRSMFMEEPVIAFRISNESDVALKKIFLNGVLSSPGRSVPWVEDSFNYEFSGGLEPGETRTLDLSPNMFGEWRIDDQYSNREDLELTLDLFNVELADGTVVLDADSRDPAEIEREMAELQRLR